jgi:hypothetical protein
MSYSGMKWRIEGLLSLKPARVVAHMGATLQAPLCGGRHPIARKVGCVLKDGWPGIERKVGCVLNKEGWLHTERKVGCILGGRLAGYW